MPNIHKGSTLDSFLQEENLLDDAEATAAKRVLACEFLRMMEEHHVSKSKMAKKMHTSRSGVDRLLDPDNASVTLKTLVKAAHTLGKRLEISLCKDDDAQIAS